MAFILRGHGSSSKKTVTEATPENNITEARPTGGDIAIDERADFGYLYPEFEQDDHYLPVDLQTVKDLDELGSKMIENGGNDINATPDSTLAPVLTYWGQFLDHELTAGTDRDSRLTGIADTPIDDKPAVHPPTDPVQIENGLKNVRTPRFDLDSVYGGDPLGKEVPSNLTVAVASVIAAMRDPDQPAKMRVGTVTQVGGISDTLDAQRDLPRFNDVDELTRSAMLEIAPDLENKLDGKALIGDMRNDENLIIAQFHLSFLRFHNSVVDFLGNNDTGWIADFHSAKLLTRLHYQWLITEGYLKAICAPEVVDRIIEDGAPHFFAFRNEYGVRHDEKGTQPDNQNQNEVAATPQGKKALGNAFPLEFSVAAFRFGHTMVRNSYDYNEQFGRPNSEATFDLLFAFTGGGGFHGSERVPGSWIIDWSRFVGTAPQDSSDGKPARNARSIDTELAPPLKEMTNAVEGDEPFDIQALFKHLARRNLRRGYNMKIVTGQALHRYLKDRGAVQSEPITDISTLFDHKPDLQQFLQNSASALHEKTPLWFYILAEAEALGGNTLGELGSWLVASTFIGVLLDDPDSALTRGFEPEDSPLKMPDGSPVNSIEKWMRFAGVMA